MPVNYLPWLTETDNTSKLGYPGQKKQGMNPLHLCCWYVFIQFFNRSVSDTQKFIKLCQVKVKEKKSLELGLFTWDSFNMTFMLIGACGFVNVNWNSKSAEIGRYNLLSNSEVVKQQSPKKFKCSVIFWYYFRGYWLSVDHQGKGIVSEACKKLMDIGFSKLGLNTIRIECAEEN